MNPIKGFVNLIPILEYTRSFQPTPALPYGRVGFGNLVRRICVHVLSTVYVILISCQIRPVFEKNDFTHVQYHHRRRDSNLGHFKDKSGVLAAEV